MCRYDEINIGTFLRADNSFTCIPEGAIRQVQRATFSQVHDYLDGFYVLCAHGKHFLDGQRVGEECVGFTIVEKGE